MCSNDSPSQKRDGATGPVQTPITTKQLLSDYGGTIDDLRHTTLPDARLDELITLCINVQEQLNKHDAVSQETALELVTNVAEAMEQVRDATVVSDPDDLPESRALDTGVPTAEYVLTPEERDETLGALSAVLFTLVETPGVGNTATASEIVQ